MTPQNISVPAGILRPILNFYVFFIQVSVFPFTVNQWSYMISAFYVIII